MNKKIINLVVSRLSTLPQDVMLSIGSKGTFSRKELIQHTKNNDEIGEETAKIELEYLRSMKKGIFYG